MKDTRLKRLLAIGFLAGALAFLPPGLSAAKEFEREIKEYQKLLEANPDDLDALYRMGVLYARRGDYDQALNVYEDILKNEPRYIDAEIGIARVYGWKGDNILAKARFEELIRKYPRNIEAYQGLALLYLWNNDFEKSIEYFNKALSLKSNDITNLKGIGRAYLGRGDRERAEEYFTKAQIEEFKGTPKELILGWAAVAFVAFFAVVFLIRHFVSKAKKRLLLRELYLLRYAVAFHHQKHGNYPLTLERLPPEPVLLPGVKGEKKPLGSIRQGDRGFLLDPFGNRYLYNPDTGGVFSTSRGFEEI